MYIEIKEFSDNLIGYRVSEDFLERVKDGLMCESEIHMRKLHYLKTIAVIHTRRQLSRERMNDTSL